MKTISKKDYQILSSEVIIKRCKYKHYELKRDNQTNQFSNEYKEMIRKRVWENRRQKERKIKIKL